MTTVGRFSAEAELEREQCRREAAVVIGEVRQR